MLRLALSIWKCYIFHHFLLFKAFSSYPYFCRYKDQYPRTVLPCLWILVCSQFFIPFYTLYMHSEFSKHNTLKHISYQKSILQILFFSYFPIFRTVAAVPDKYQSAHPPLKTSLFRYHSRKRSISASFHYPSADNLLVRTSLWTLFAWMHP